MKILLGVPRTLVAGSSLSYCHLSLEGPLVLVALEDVSCGGLKSARNRCTVQPFTESDDTRCCENTICPPEDGHVNARNMSRIIV